MAGEKIASATLVHITVYDGIPLPDPALLQMQWMLQCVIALAGGAEALEESNDGDDDDYYDYPELYKEYRVPFEQLHLPPTSPSLLYLRTNSHWCMMLLPRRCTTLRLATRKPKVSLAREAPLSIVTPPAPCGRGWLNVCMIYGCHMPLSIPVSSQ